MDRYIGFLGRLLQLDTHPSVALRGRLAFQGSWSGNWLGQLLA